MPFDRLAEALRKELDELRSAGTLKGDEDVVTEVVPAHGDHGPRVRLRDGGDKLYLRMNSNSYLGMSLQPELIEAEEKAARAFGTGPGAVRFISGTYEAHVELEQQLAMFHGRAAGMLFSSAYATTMGVLPALITPETAVISDALNHNCIINAMRLARPLDKRIYPHLDMDALEQALAEPPDGATRAVVVTDGIFSMRGDHAPVNRIMEIARKHDAKWAENIVVIVDDSHGVGAFGRTGRGTEEFTGSPPADILVATLGKALGVNGGYVTSTDTVIRFFRETSPMYIYSNPITPGEKIGRAHV